MPTRSAVLAAVIPAIIVFAVFWRWLGFGVGMSAVLGLVWSVSSLFVTRLLYDAPESELAAWRAAAPDLQGSWDREDAWRTGP